MGERGEHLRQDANTPRAAPARGMETERRVVGPWCPSAKQLDALTLLEGPLTRLVLDGGGRSGKTACIAHWMLSRAARYAGSWHVVLRKARSHTVQSLWNGTFFDYLSKHWPDQRYWVLKRDELMIHFPFNNSRILFDGCDDEARVRKLYGNEYMSLWFNEASEFPWEVVEQLMSRLVQRGIDSQGNEGLCKAVFDTNPRGPRHWLYRVGVLGVHPVSGEPLQARQKWGRLGGWTISDNAANLAGDALQTYEDQDEITKRRMLYGEWVADQGAVYSEFTEGLVIGAADCMEMSTGTFKGKACYRSIDFGYRDPFVCLFAGVDWDGRLVIYDEIYRTGRIVSDHAGEIMERSKVNTVWYTVCDHDAEDAATLRRDGVVTRPAWKDRPIRDGLARVKKRLQEGRLLFVRPDRGHRYGCPGLLSEIESYVWDREGDKPVGKDDHAMDALRYLVAELDRRVGSVLIAGA
ncbi:MAG: phage terminase large subunit [Gammaproteobacteria bacterium]|nr:phage terminase large subunit [Gammaproteobacteria bacterium]